MEFKSSKNIPTIVFLCLWVSLVIYKVTTNNQPLAIVVVDNNIFVILFVGSISVFIVYKLIWMLTGKVKITTENDLLIVQKVIAGFSILETYELKKIHEIHIVNTALAKTYWGIKGFRIYDKGMNLLTFQYDSKTIYIGRELNAFIASHVKKQIESAISHFK